MGKISDVLVEEEDSFEKKNEWLRNYFPEVTPEEFYRDLFPRGSFERKGIYEDRKGNGILVKIENAYGNKKKIHRYTVTDDLDVIFEAIKSSDFNDFCILSPVSYCGKSRTSQNSRYLYSLTFDVDGIEIENLTDLFYQIDNYILPRPTYIVNSGHGVHLYYQFKQPIPMYPKYRKALRDIKYALTPRLWNIYTSKDENIQYQSIFQGFRVVGSPTKLGFTTTAFKCGEPITVEELCSFIPEKDFPIRGMDDIRRLTIAEAKEKYPEWYQERVVEHKPRKHWVVKRALYDWWKNKITTEINNGHRYFSIMVLAIYGKKCGIPFDEVEEDAFSFVSYLDSLSKTLYDTFTYEDVEAALQAYNDNYITFPRASIEKVTKVSIPANKRNYQKQEWHLEDMRMKKANMKKRGQAFKHPEGRPKGSGTAEAKVKAWREEHPNGRKVDCIRETGLSKPTVYKWWSKD